jgi:hypothetical protein
MRTVRKFEVISDKSNVHRICIKQRVDPKNKIKYKIIIIIIIIICKMFTTASKNIKIPIRLTLDLLKGPKYVA